MFNRGFFANFLPSNLCRGSEKHLLARSTTQGNPLQSFGHFCFRALELARKPKNYKPSIQVVREVIVPICVAICYKIQIQGLIYHPYQDSRLFVFFFQFFQNMQSHVSSDTLNFKFTFYEPTNLCIIFRVFYQNPQFPEKNDLEHPPIKLFLLIFDYYKISLETS